MNFAQKEFQWIARAYLVGNLKAKFGKQEIQRKQSCISYF